MKKLLSILIAALVIISVAAVTVSAYGKGQNNACKGNGTYFVDSDNNGICDNKTTSGKNQNQSNKGNGANFVDADNNGICDNRTACGKRNGKCSNR